jgi:hypothetical protein
LWIITDCIARYLFYHFYINIIDKMETGKFNHLEEKAEEKTQEKEEEKVEEIEEKKAEEKVSFIPIETIPSTNGILSTGIVYLIKNAMYETYLQASGWTGDEDNKVYAKPREEKDMSSQEWVIEKYNADSYLIRNVKFPRSCLHPGDLVGRDLYVNQHLYFPWNLWQFDDLEY